MSDDGTKMKIAVRTATYTFSKSFLHLYVIAVRKFD